jgi:hypothetical protein
MSNDLGVPHPSCTSNPSSVCSLCQMLKIVHDGEKTHSKCNSGHWGYSGGHNRLDTNPVAIVNRKDFLYNRGGR